MSGQRLIVPARLAAAALAGASASLGFAPYRWAPATWLAVGCLIWLAATAPGRGTALWSGYLFGLAYFAALLWWIIPVELVGYVPLVLLQALSYWGLAAAVYRFREAPPARFVLAAAGSLALMEFLRVRWPVGGFPWGLPGLTVSPTPLRAASQWVGATGWTVILTALVAAAALWAMRRVSWRLPAAAAVAIAGLAAAGAVWPATADGPSRTVAIVQGNSPCPMVRCAGEREAIYRSHLRLTRALPPGPDLVVWAESSTGGPADPLRNEGTAAEIGEEARRLGAPLLVGGDLDNGPGSFINVNLLFNKEGELAGEYRKRHPVPFGEFVPLRPLLDWIPAIDRVPRDMARGEGPVWFDLDGLSFASVISYEGAYARYEREAAAGGARLLVVATNEASFGTSPVSDQFLDITRLRAAELGTDIVHAAVTGRSAIVHADGRVTGPTGLFETTVLVGEAGVRTAGPTLYARWGDWLQVAAIVGWAGLWAGSMATRRRR